MALQDLTPQLRTRLHRVEKVVTLFVVLAAVLLLVGFGYYLHDTGKRKGWFIPKCRYFTMLMTAEGLKVGDPVILMGFNVGEIVKIDTMPPEMTEKIFISFDIRQPYYGYIWTDSRLHIKSNLLGGRKLEILPGFNGKPTVAERQNRPHEVLDKGKMVPIAQAPKGVYIIAKEDIAIADQAQELIAKIHASLPGVLAMTNQVTAVLASVVQITSNLNNVLVETKPILNNVQFITANLTNKNGSLGDWLIPTNLNARIDTVLGSVNTTLGTANQTVTNMNAQITLTTANLNQVLLNVSLITSNLNNQFKINDNLLGNVSDLLIETEDLLRGLKRHWLLKSAFPQPTTNLPPTQLHELQVAPPTGGGK